MDDKDKKIEELEKRIAKLEHENICLRGNLDYFADAAQKRQGELFQIKQDREEFLRSMLKIYGEDMTHKYVFPVKRLEDRVKDLAISSVAEGRFAKTHEIELSERVFKLYEDLECEMTAHEISALEALDVISARALLTYEHCKVTDVELDVVTKDHIVELCNEYGVVAPMDDENSVTSLRYVFQILDEWKNRALNAEARCTSLDDSICALREKIRSLYCRICNHDPRRTLPTTKRALEEIENQYHMIVEKMKNEYEAACDRADKNHDRILELSKQLDDIRDVLDRR